MIGKDPAFEFGQRSLTNVEGVGGGAESNAQVDPVSAETNPGPPIVDETLDDAFGWWPGCNNSRFLFVNPETREMAKRLRHVKASEKEGD